MARRRDWSLARDLKEVGLNWTDIGKIYRTSGGSVSRGVRRGFGEPVEGRKININEYSDILKLRIKEEINENYDDVIQIKDMLWTIYGHQVPTKDELYNELFFGGLESNNSGDDLLFLINKGIEDIYWYYINKGLVKYLKILRLDGLNIQVEGLGFFNRTDYETINQVEYRLVFTNGLVEDERGNIDILKEDLQSLVDHIDFEGYTYTTGEIQSIITFKLTKEGSTDNE